MEKIKDSTWLGFVLVEDDTQTKFTPGHPGLVKNPQTGGPSTAVTHDFQKDFYYRAATHYHKSREVGLRLIDEMREKDPKWAGYFGFGGPLESVSFNLATIPQFHGVGKERVCIGCFFI